MNLHRGDFRPPAQGGFLRRRRRVTIAALIDYVAEALELVRAAAVEGLHRLSRGGLEVGGVLFGNRKGTRLRILASRPFVCEHAFGPALRLSEADHAGLRKLLETAASDPELAGMEPLGWHRSQTRGEFGLTPDDIQVLDQHFPEPWQMMLLLRPEKMKPTRAAFFVRASDGSLELDQEHGVFDLHPLPRQRKASSGRADSKERDAGEAPVRFSMRARGMSRWAWLTLALGWCALAVAWALLYRGYWWPGEPERLEIRLADQGGSLEIRWDNGAAAVRQANAGLLEVLDGGRRWRFGLTREELRRGSFTFLRQSADVSIRLGVTQPGGRQAVGAARLAGAAGGTKGRPRPLVGTIE